MDNNYTDSLQHYGILGMKWGIRRFQNDDGSLTEKGRKRYLHSTDEVLTEKQKAYETGKAATVTGYAAQKAQKRADRANARLEKAEESGNAKKVEKAKAKADLHNKVAEQLWKDYEDYAKKGEEHVAKLISEYGEENVKGLRYRENKLKSGKGPDKLISERTFNAKDVAVSAGKTFVTNVALRLMGAPIAVIYTPPSAGQQGRAMANERLRQAKREQTRQQATPSSKTVTNSNWSYTKEERAAAKTKANEKDVWNLEFLERVQNKTYADGTSRDPQKKKRMMQEYDAFLKDPVNYWPPDGDEQ